MEFREDQNYNISEDTIDYKTGFTFKEFNSKNLNYEFSPSTFIRITGKSDDNDEDLPDVKKNY